jgi:hypothetical protein
MRRERVAGELAAAQRDTHVIGERDMHVVEVLAQLFELEDPWHSVVRLGPVVERAQLLDV